MVMKHLELVARRCCSLLVLVITFCIRVRFCLCVWACETYLWTTKLHISVMSWAFKLAAETFTYVYFMAKGLYHYLREGKVEFIALKRWLVNHNVPLYHPSHCNGLDTLHTNSRTMWLFPLTNKMVGLDQQSAPKRLINEVPSHVVLVNNKVGVTGGVSRSGILIDWMVNKLRTSDTAYNSQCAIGCNNVPNETTVNSGF